MKRMPEKPEYAEAQDKKEARVFFGSIAVGSVLTLWFVENSTPQGGVFSRFVPYLALFGCMFLGNAIKERMAKEHSEKVRVWLDYWDEYKDDMKKLEMEIEADCDEYTKETKKIKLESMKRYYDNNFY